MRLDEIISYSEKEFLKIGETLHEIDQQATNITAEANLLKAAVKHTLFESQKEYFNSVVLNKKEILPALNQIEDILTQIGALLMDDQNNLLKLINQVKRMQKTDLVVRVELAHHTSVADAYANLLKQVVDLAYHIKFKAEQLLSVSLILSTHLNSSSGVIHLLFTQITNQSAQIHEKGLNRLTQMRLNHKRAQDLSCALASSGKELHQNLNIIASKLQAHDIVRQQLQHVIVLLQDFSSENAPIPLLKQSLVSLNKANNEFFDAIENIRLQMVSVSSNLTGLLDSCIQLVSRDFALDKENNQEIEKESGSHMTDIVSATSECIKVESILSSLIKTISVEITKNAQTVQDMFSLGSDIELSAQNASLTAGNLKESESALTIMAEQTQRDISSIQNLFSTIVTTQNEMATKSEQLSSLFHQNSLDIENIIEVLTEFDERLVPLENIQHLTTLRISKLKSQLELIITTISPLIDSFHSDIYNSSAIAEAINLLYATISELSPGTEASIAAPTGIEKEIQIYRQNIETDVQNRLVNEGNHLSDHPKNKSAGDLGDDIEIF